MHIQWYPGHMTKTKRLIQENIKLIDLVIEIVDARAPYSTKNPDIDTFAGNKPRLIIFNKADLADENKTDIWMKWYTKKDVLVLPMIATTGKGMQEVIKGAETLLKEKIERDKARGRIYRPIRAMIVGIPNVGKSTFINSLVGKKSAKTGDKPGVTRGKQWVKIKKGFELLDTPGILWPKFEDQEVAKRLAFIGAISDNIIDSREIALALLEWVKQYYPSEINARYQIDCMKYNTPYDLFCAIGNQRGMIRSKGVLDDTRNAKMLLDEFRAGKWGKLSIEIPEDIH